TRYGDFYRVGGIAAKREVAGQPDAVPRGQLAPVTYLLRGAAQHVRQAAGMKLRSAVIAIIQLPRLTEQLEPQCQRVLAHADCDFVDKALGGKRREGRQRPTPPSTRQREVDG